MCKLVTALSLALTLFALSAPIAFAAFPVLPPTLTKSPDAGYVDDAVSSGVVPNIGTTSATVFTFKVLYAQSQNRVPFDLNIVATDGTTTRTYEMTRDLESSDPILRDGNYINGEQYVYSTTFTSGIWQYHFASDFGAQLPATGEWTFIAHADPVTPFGPPMLSFATTAPEGLYEDDGIQDHKGTAGKTHFTFSTMYTDAANRAPQNISVTIVPEFEAGNPTPSIPITMALTEDTTTASTTLKDGDYRNGELFAYYHPLTFAKHTYRYSFSAFVGGATTTIPAAPENQFSFKTGYSNVAFLPGLMGSRLFEESDVCGIFTNEKERWVSKSDCDHARLALDAGGRSIHPLYTKEGEDGVIDDAYSANLYQSFISDLDTWKNDDHLIADYVLIPYDWRLSLEDILQNGATTTSGLSYSTSQGFVNSYIYRKLTEMAGSSHTGRVTIVAHSNGGLVTKALIQKLKETNDPLYDKIDNVILVAVPQVGTPEAVSNILHGDQIGPTGFVMDAERLRNLTQNMPGAYHLLPSRAYFGGTGSSVTTPVVTFLDGTSTQPFISAYGHEITTPLVLHDFLLGIEGRTQPAYDDLKNPTKLRANLLSYAQDIHQQIDDAWEFSTSTKIYQIAGWGEKTLATLEYRSVRDCERTDSVYFAGRTHRHCGLWGSKLTFDPKEVIDGDGTVVTPSALAMSTSSERVKRYWVDLEKFNNPFLGIDRVHKDILEVSSLRELIHNIVSQSINQPIDFISTSTPPSTSDDRLTFTLHSPLTLEFTDTLGRHVGPSTSTQDEIDSNVPGARYKRYGEVQLLSIPSTATGTLTLRGVSSGSFTLDITEENGDTTIATTSFEGILSATSTVATMLINPAFSPVESGTLVIDIDGDGTTDETLHAKEGATVFPDITPPEAHMGFSSTTKNLTIQGFDNLGSTTMQTTATGTIIADQSGNILYVPFLGMKEKNRRAVLSFNTLLYNGSTTIIATTTVSYKWKTDASGKFTMFAAYIKAGTTTTEVHYRPKKNITIVMTKPQDLDGSDTYEDCDARPIKIKLTGMVVPSIVTKQGKIEINY